METKTNTCKTCLFLDPTARYEHSVNIITTHCNCLNVASNKFGENCCNRTTWGKRTIDTRDLQTCDKWEAK